MTFVSTLRKQRMRDSLDDGVRGPPATVTKTPSSYRIPLGGSPSIQFTDAGKGQGVVGTGGGEGGLQSGTGILWAIRGEA